MTITDGTVGLVLSAMPVVLFSLDPAYEIKGLVEREKFNFQI